MGSRLSALLVSLLLVPSLLALVPGESSAADRFTDGDRTVHTEAIEAIAQVGVASGYPDGTYRPQRAVSRDQMATFLRRALQLPAGSHDFDDVAQNSTHSDSIGAILAADVTRGCGEDRYCPREPVTRAQMATFLKRALDLPDDPDRSFDDVDPEASHAPGIRAVAAAGITQGCGDGSRYCPTDPVQRDQMAAFLDRALGLDGPVPCRDPEQPIEPTTVGNAVEGYLLGSVVRSDDHLELISMDLEESRSARVSAGSGDTGVAGTATIPTGTRTWATAEHEGTVYVGQDTGGTNLYRFSSEDADDRAVEPVASVPYGGEFWALTTDDDGDRLWAGTRGHREDGDLEDDEHVLYRIDDPATSPSAPQPVRFSVDGLPGEGGQRPDIAELHWHEDPEDGTETLFVGLGGSAVSPGDARLYALTDLEAPDGPQVTDLTPPVIAGEGNLQLEISSLAVTDTHLAIGTRSEDRPRVAVYDRASETWVSNTRLPEGNRRVDEVALGDGRVVAATFPTGRLWEADLGDDVASVGAPPGGQHTATRFLELDGSTVRGVTSRGLLWTRTDGDWGGTVPFGSRAGSSALSAPGLAQSLTLTDDHVVTGANSSVHARPHDDPSSHRLTPIGGEAKALATDGERVWAASYPGAVLWSIDVASQTAAEVRTWDGRYQRPRDAAYSHHRDEIVVVARADPGFESALFAFSPDGSHYAAERVEDGEPGDRSDEDNVRATAVATHGNYAFVGMRGIGGWPGSESGGVAAYDLRPTAGGTLQKKWYVRPARGRIVSLDMVDGRLVGVAETNSKGGGNTWFELNPGSGRVLAAGNDDTRLGRGPIGDAAPLGPVTIGAMGRDVASIQRGADRATSLYRHDAHETFSGPFLDIDRRGGRCDIHAIEGREIFRLPYDPATRLDR